MEQIPKFSCRPGCAACCIAPSISSALPGMPHGKPAGVRCVNLSALNLCVLWGKANFPKVCLGFRPDPEVCGETNEQALNIISQWEVLTGSTS